MLMLAVILNNSYIRDMTVIDQVITFLTENKDAILVGASAVVIIDFAARALKSGAEMTSSVLVFILKIIWRIALKPLLLLMMWLLELIISLVSWVQEERRTSSRSEAEATTS